MKTPIPAKITFAGENTYKHIYKRKFQGLYQLKSWDLPDWRPRRWRQKTPTGRSQLGSTSLSVCHHHCEICQILRLDLVEWRWWPQWSCRIGAGRQVDVRSGFSSSAFGRISMQLGIYLGSVRKIWLHQQNHIPFSFSLSALFLLCPFRESFCTYWTPSINLWRLCIFPSFSN